MDDEATDYIFEVDGPNRTRFYIDGATSDSLMAKVNGAKTKRQRRLVNVEAYQYAQRIFTGPQEMCRKEQNSSSTTGTSIGDDSLHHVLVEFF